MRKSYSLPSFLLIIYKKYVTLHPEKTHFINMIVILIALLLAAVIALAITEYKKYRTNLNNNMLLSVIMYNISSYVFLIDDKLRVKQTNYYALNNIKEKGPVKLLGNVLGCENGVEAGECGKHSRCRECVLRYTINKTFANKGEFSDIETTMRLYNGEKSPVNVDVNVSGRYTTVNDKPHMVIGVANITEDKKLMRCLLHENSETERIVMENTDNESRLSKLSHAVGIGKEMPKVLFDTQNIGRFNRVAALLDKRCKVVYGEDADEAVEKSKKSSLYKYTAIMLDDTFIYSNSKIIENIMQVNTSIPIIIFTSDDTMNDHDNLHYILEPLTDEELIDSVMKIVIPS